MMQSAVAVQHGLVGNEKAERLGTRLELGRIPVRQEVIDDVCVFSSNRHPPWVDAARVLA